VPGPGVYRELVNSDSRHYGGSDLGNAGGVAAEPVAHLGLPWSLALTLPPLAGLVLAPG
jgi:1,4-alpha-glucan branching enzyme